MNRQESKWNKMFGQLAEYCKTNELEPSKYTEPELWSWFSYQKQAMRSGKLRQDRMDKMGSIKFSGPPPNEKLLPVYEKLRQWRAANPRKWPHYNRNDKRSEESKLYIFCQEMRKRYRHNDLSEYWVKKLAKINFNFRGKADNWVSRYNEIKALIAEHNSISVSVIGWNRYYWIIRHKRKLEAGELPAHQAALIRELQLGRFFVTWDMRFAQAKQWVEENQRLPTRVSHRTHHSWLISQRITYRRGNLSEYQVKKLRSIGFKFVSTGNADFKKKWLEKFHQYIKFREKHGRDPRYYCNDEFEKKLYCWVMNQRAVMAGTAWNRKPLSKQRTDKLDSINFVWVVQPGSGMTWDENFEKFKKNIQPNGRLVLTVKMDGKINATYTWWTGQKRAFQEGKMSAERIAAFKKAGIDFNSKKYTRQKKWTEIIHEIAAFIEKNGSYPKTRKSKEENNLYQSLANTRRLHRAGKLSDQQLRLIKELKIKL